MLTLSLPLPWTFESLWILIQLSAQIFIITAVILLIYFVIYFYFLALTDDSRVNANFVRGEIQRQREAEEEKRQENLDEWRQEIHSLLHKISERIDKN